MFCVKCGQQLPDDAIFCSRCGNKVSISSEEVSDPTPQTYTLTLDRASQVYAINPPIKVLIDNNIRTSVDNGKTEQLQVIPGHHTVVLTGSFRTTTVEIDLQKDTCIEISFNRLTGKIMAKVI
mgnify:CR=1 FL=1